MEQITIGAILKTEDGNNPVLTGELRAEDAILADDQNYSKYFEDQLVTLSAAYENLNNVEDMIVATVAAGEVGEEFKTEDARAYADKLDSFLKVNKVPQALINDHGLGDLRVEDGFSGSSHTLRTEDAKGMLKTIKDSILKFIDMIIDGITKAGPELMRMFSTTKSFSEKLIKEIDEKSDDLIDNAKVDIPRLVANFGGFVKNEKDALKDVLDIANSKDLIKNLDSLAEDVSTTEETKFDDLNKYFGAKGTKLDVDAVVQKIKLADGETLKNYSIVKAYTGDFSVLVLTDKGVKKHSIKKEGKDANDFYSSAKVMSRADLKSLAESVKGYADKQKDHVKAATDAMVKVKKYISKSDKISSADKAIVQASISSLSNIAYGGPKTNKAVLVVVASNSKLYKKAEKK